MMPRQIERKIGRELALENHLALHRLAIVDAFVRLVGRPSRCPARRLPSPGPSPTPSATARDRLFAGSLGVNSIRILFFPLRTTGPTELIGTQTAGRDLVLIEKHRRLLRVHFLLS